jgi:predicted secreted hydrolase
VRLFGPRPQPIVAIILVALLLASVTATRAQSESGARAAGTPAAESTRSESITFPEDDSPHSSFIEWWYYTGHLFTETGARYGFEFVVFKGEQNGAVAGYASHFAITDDERGTFQYDQQFVLASGEATPPPTEPGFDLRVGDWRMWGSGGSDRLVASLPDYAIALSLEPEKPVTLHDHDGYITYGSSEYTYYYSRTRLDISGTLRVDGESLPVTGEAWMDHQWGYFTMFSGTGWDWYALQLSDRTDVMLYVVPAQGTRPAILDGSIVAPNGEVTILEEGDFTITATGSWTSPETGVTYPSAWSIEMPGDAISLTVKPSMPEQEIDASATTGVIYWEGEVEIDGTHAGEAVTGLGYVELTGHDKRSDSGASGQS